MRFADQDVVFLVSGLIGLDRQLLLVGLPAGIIGVVAKPDP